MFAKFRSSLLVLFALGAGDASARYPPSFNPNDSIIVHGGALIPGAQTPLGGMIIPWNNGSASGEFWIGEDGRLHGRTSVPNQAGGNDMHFYSPSPYTNRAPSMSRPGGSNFRQSYSGQTFQRYSSGVGCSPALPR